jgi:hypothetical protein
MDNSDTNINFNRREFLELLTALGAAFFLDTKSFNSKAYASLDNSKFLYLSGNVKTTKNFASGFEMDGSKSKLIDTTFRVHSFVQHPVNSSIFVLLNKWGNESCIIDWQKEVVLQKIPAMKNSNFYGHGLFTAKGDALLTTETNWETGKGFLSIRDPKFFKEIDIIDVGGTGPHDCTLSTDGKNIIVPISGVKVKESKQNKKHEFNYGESHLAVIELSSGKILEKIPNPVEGLEMAHLLKATTESIFIATTSARQKKAPTIIFTRLGGSVKELQAPAHIQRRFKSEILSLAEHKKAGIVAATCPDANLITFWDSLSGEFRGSLDHSSPLGICMAHDGESFAVSSGSDGQVLLINPMTFKFLDLSPKIKAGNGSHLYLGKL